MPLRHICKMLIADTCLLLFLAVAPSAETQQPVIHYLYDDLGRLSVVCSPPPTTASTLAAFGQGPHAGDPVNLATGVYVLRETDLVLRGRVSIVFTRTYRTLDPSPGPFGPGTSHTYEIWIQSVSANALLLTLPGNSRSLFSRQADGRLVNETEPGLRGTAATSIWRGWRGWNLTFKDQTVWTFNAHGILIRQRDGNGNTLTISRDIQGRLTALTDPTGRQLSVRYSDRSLRISSITDALGRIVRYAYDTGGRLTSVTDPAGGVTTYTYNGSNKLATITDPSGVLFVRNEYTSDGRVSRQTLADGGVFTFSYTLTNGAVTQTAVTDPDGNRETFRFNASGYEIGFADRFQQITYERQPGTNLLLSATDALGRKIVFTYDAQGNMTSPADLAGSVWTLTHLEHDATQNLCGPGIPLAKELCKDNPRVVGPCITVHGRLSLYIGNPSIRIWRIGTKRILGLTGGESPLPWQRSQ